MMTLLLRGSRCSIYASHHILKLDANLSTVLASEVVGKPVKSLDNRLHHYTIH